MAASDSMVMHEIATSNIPPAKKSAIRRWYEGMTGVVSGAGDAVKRHATEGVHVIRQGSESALTGAALGLIAAERGGLDVHVQGHEVPIDAVVAALGLGASVFLARDPTGLSTDARNVGSASLSVYAFRKTQAWRLHGKHGLPAAHSAHHGDDEDPIVEASRHLG